MASSSSSYEVPPADSTPTSLPHLNQRQEVEDKGKEKVDYKNLPCPVPFEEITREIFLSLKPEHFEGMRFDFVKGLNQKFALSHGVFMGPVEIPSDSKEVIKIPFAQYEFGTNYVDPKLMLIGKVLTDGTLNARMKCDLTDRLTLSGNAQLTSQPHMSQGTINFDYKGKDYRTQFRLGKPIIGASYIQSVTPHLSLGGDILWIGQSRNSDFACAARYNTDKMIATGQVASNGLVGLSYLQKLSLKVSLATDFVYNHMSRDVVASVGYDYMLRQSHIRGKIDSNGRTSTFLEEQLSMGLKFLLSAEMDHKKRDYKFGFGMTVGE